MPTSLLLLILTLLAFALPASAAAGEYVPGELIVRYEDGTSADGAAAARAEAETETERTLPGGSEQLAILDGDSVRETIAELEQDPNVAYAVPNWKARAAARMPNDPVARRQWNLFKPWGINLVEAWTHAEALGAPGGRGAVVAVLDSGVAFERYGRFRRAPDLRRKTFIRPYDFVGNDRHPNDSFGHGTHVAGTIAQATNNGVATAGIAYNAKIMPLRVLDDIGTGDSVAIARAIRYASRHGADVINLSVEFPPELRGFEIPEILSALRYARRRGALVVGAAGNEADVAVAYPARTPAVLAVAATTITGCQANYSNSGDDLDLAAPGGGDDAPNDDSAWDRAHCDPNRWGKPIYQQTLIRRNVVNRFGLPDRPPNRYEGTSMAAPHVSAIAALVVATKRLGANPTPAQLEAHLKATARPTDRPDRYGAGLVDAGAALRIAPAAR